MIGDHGSWKEVKPIEFSVGRHSLAYTGPFFIEGDHSCFHGAGTHGAGVTRHDALGEGLPIGREVFARSLSGIDQADVVFSYIDSGDCHGTLFELGYARHSGKRICLAFANEALARDMWFPAQCSFGPVDIGEVFHEERPPKNAKQVFEEWLDRAYPLDYRAALRLPQWQRRRLDILKRDNFTCQECRSTTKPLNIHHLRYIDGKQPWEYEDRDLMTLCEDCHSRKPRGRSERPSRLPLPADTLFDTTRGPVTADDCSFEISEEARAAFEESFTETVDEEELT
jgi:5-methylcytosine-specific restriction endonuclease McrA